MESLWIALLCCALVTSDYVPLNSLTISSLYSEKKQESVTEKPWWTDLQEKRQQYKAAKIRAQQLQFDNGKIINLKPATQDESITEFPRPIEPRTTPDTPLDEWPSGRKFEFLIVSK